MKAYIEQTWDDIADPLRSNFLVKRGVSKLWPYEQTLNG